MKALRIILNQSQAHYRKEETMTNKMTYPLPPFSTVIGAIHNACRFTEYHPMNVSIQGQYGAMQKEPYKDYAFLNSTMNDRGILVQLKNARNQSTAFEVIAEAKKSMGSDFEKEKFLAISNQKLLDNYKRIKADMRKLTVKKKTEIDPIISEYKRELQELKQELKKHEKNSEEYIFIKEKLEKKKREKEVVEEGYKLEKMNLDKEYSKFASLTTSLKFYEVLYDLKLIIHIQSDEETLVCIQDSIYDLKAIGRSEDFVQIEHCEFVELKDTCNTVESSYSAYIRNDNIKNEVILGNMDESQKAYGTKYFMNKTYTIENNKRKFEKHWVIYTSKYTVDEESQLGEETGVYIDEDTYIVNFI